MPPWAFAHGPVCLDPFLAFQKQWGPPAPYHRTMKLEPVAGEAAGVALCRVHCNFACTIGFQQQCATLAFNAIRLVQYCSWSACLARLL